MHAQKTRAGGSVVFWCLFLLRLHRHPHLPSNLRLTRRPPTFLRRCQIALPYAAPPMAVIANFTTPTTLRRCWPYNIIISIIIIKTMIMITSPPRLHDAVLLRRWRRRRRPVGDESCSRRGRPDGVSRKCRQTRHRLSRRVRSLPSLLANGLQNNIITSYRHNRPFANLRDWIQTKNIKNHFPDAFVGRHRRRRHWYCYHVSACVWTYTYYIISYCVRR